MTLPQRNTVLAKPTNFYYLMCKLDRAQYRVPVKWCLRRQPSKGHIIMSSDKHLTMSERETIFLMHNNQASLTLQMA